MNGNLDDVLRSYAQSDAGPSSAGLIEWAARYPHFVSELTAFTARWRLLVWTADASLLPGGQPQDLTHEDIAAEERLILRGVSAVQAVFFSKKRGESTVPSAQKADPPIRGLLREAQANGLISETFAARVELSEGLLRKLDRRLIAPASIPAAVCRQIADVLGKSVTSVERYFELPPTFAAGARHLARKAPALPSKQEDFVDAVRNDLELDKARRQTLLTLPRPPRASTEER